MGIKLTRQNITIMQKSHFHATFSLFLFLFPYFWCFNKSPNIVTTSVNSKQWGNKSYNAQVIYCETLKICSSLWICEFISFAFNITKRTRIKETRCKNTQLKLLNVFLLFYSRLQNDFRFRQYQDTLQHETLSADRLFINLFWRIKNRSNKSKKNWCWPPK